MAYKLKLLEESRIHLIFHVSLLKKKLGETNDVSVELPPLIVDEEIIIEPEAILDTRSMKKGSYFVKESLVKWKHLPKNDATWDNVQEL